MPKEKKHRGRRSETKDKKRKRDPENENGEELAILPKRQKSQELRLAEEASFIPFDDTLPPQDEARGPIERPFYGMLEDEEQEYFRRADELLELNDFPTPEERSLFIESVWREAEGKELKIACSQGCSRLMERLILLSGTRKKKRLFGTFAGNIAHLVQHRFASHCVEMLFVRSAGVVTRELTGEEVIEDKEKEEGGMGEQGEAEFASMESLFLATLDELEGQMTFLLTDRFASHTLRVLLVILSGRPLEKEETNSLLKSKRKEKVGIANMNSTSTEVSLNKRAVPESFQFAVEKIISDTVATMDTSFIRVLATHPTGNPTLQLLLELELTNPTTKKGANSGKKTIIFSLLPDDIEIEGSSSAIFINGIMYDQIGSRLLETICTYAPAKLFKQIYKTTFKDRIAGLARNEISSYVVMKVLTRISKEDLEDAVEQICPQVSGLVERNRTVIIKTLMERCHVRRSAKSVEKLTTAIATAYGSNPETLLLKMVCIENVDALIEHTNAASHPEEEQQVPMDLEQTEEVSKKPKSRRSVLLKQFISTPQQTHGSLLAQSLLTIPGTPSTLIQTSLLALPQPTLQALTLYLPTSHILQSAMDPSTPPIFRRKLINKFLFSPEHEDTIFTLAISPIGSHFLDALLSSTGSTQSLFILTERVAETLRKQEAQLRESFTGRIIWRNWHLDLYKRKRGEWVNTVKELAVAKYPSENAQEEAGVENTAAVKPNAKNKNKNKNGNSNGRFEKKADQGPKKSAIQLAMERHAAGKKRPDANATKLGPRKGKGEEGKEDFVHPDRRVAT